MQCPCGERAADDLIEVVNYMLVNPGEYSPAAALATRAKIGVITALPKEGAAFRAMMDNRAELERRDDRNRRRVYDVGTVPAIGGGSHAVIHLCLGDMGTNPAAVRAAALLHNFPDVEYIIMVGIAGGVPNHLRPEHHVRLGDIVVSDRYGVVQYDFVKQSRETLDFRWRPVPPSAQLLEAVSRIRMLEAEGKRPWCEALTRGGQLPGFSRPSAESDTLADSQDPATQVAHPIDPARVPGLPRVFYGAIASSNTLLKDALHRDELRERFGVKAIEMEASGIADATWDLEAGYLVVRGICDYCDEFKADVWQEYAALTAAAYTRALLGELPSLG